MEEIQQRAPRLPAAPLVNAVQQAQAARRVSLRRLLAPWHLRAYYLAKAEGEITPYMVERLCAAINRDPDELYGRGFQDAPIELASADEWGKPHLDVAPLVEIIEARLQRLTERLALLPGPARPRTEAIRQVFGDDAALLKTYQRARARGWVLLETAERCCDAFGWHPREIWGDRYDEAVFAGCEENYDPWGETAA
jgi:hypothetical protein